MEPLVLEARAASQRARCGVRIIYRAVQAGRLRAVRVGGRRELRLQPDWVDAWLLSAESFEKAA
jgi:excisionase family DNA binding protein